ncbi:MAG: imidazole glycerol phosphate synthase subunit HisH [Candidatus Omnitrophica bacterium]|nr:imidazole glycerol phosphate synthase subunit HisH [Candidatus Omnitrophota bacterium]
MIAIIDYGMGNIHSVKKALESLGAKTQIAQKASDIASSDKVVLPGVGAFDDAMLELEKKGLIGALLTHIKNKKYFLGICLGMQILFEESQEAKKAKGLGVLKGSVKKFSGAGGLKVPHMGWNQLKIRGLSPTTEGNLINKGTVPVLCPLFKDVPDESYVYFCHSYYPAPENKSVIAATTEYGINFASVVWQGNVFGVQFHPEKSQDTGIRILKNFVTL